MENIKATVEEVKFYTSIYGKVKPVIKLKDSFRYKGTNLDALALDSMEPILTKKIVNNCEVYFKVGQSVTIKRVKNNNGEMQLPRTCPTCGSLLFEKSYDRYCVSKSCPSVARSGVYNVLKYYGFDINDSDIINYLNQFPLNTTVNVPIHSIYDFFQFFNEKASGKKDTEARLKVLGNICENAQKIYDMEQVLTAEFKKDMTTGLLLAAINLKDITPDEAKKLIEIDYINLINSDEKADKIKSLDISPVVIEALMINSVAVQKLIDKYNELK